VIHRLDDKLPNVPLAVAQEPGLLTPGNAPSAAPSAPLPAKR